MSLVAALMHVYMSGSNVVGNGLIPRPPVVMFSRDEVAVGCKIGKVVQPSYGHSTLVTAINEHRDVTS